MGRRIYVASSWRNPFQPEVVSALREAGHEVYDFRHPSVQGPPGAPEAGFAWSDLGPDWQGWSPARFREALQHPIARRGFAADHAAMDWADTCVLVLPCGRSAHLEAGEFLGRGRPLWILSDVQLEPELMYSPARIALDLAELLDGLADDGGSS